MKRKLPWILLGVSAALLTAASVVVVIYGMQAAQRILVPILVALFLAVICTPLLNGMRRLRVPAGIAVFVIVAGIIGALALAGAFVGGSIAEFTSRHAVDFGLMAAGGIIAALPPVLLAFALQRYLVAGLTAGGIKG